jgi:hypothetical protein
VAIEGSQVAISSALGLKEGPKTFRFGEGDDHPKACKNETDRSVARVKKDVEGDNVYDNGRDENGSESHVAIEQQ